MAWVTPRTWVDGEVTTAAILNQHWRDNMNVLKASFTSNGRLSGLNSSTLADLSGLNITGLVPVANDTLYLAVNNFNAGSGTRLKVPVGTDKYGGSPGAKTPGSLWIEGEYLHHVDNTGVEWRYLGTSITSTPGDEGSVWVEGANINYVDENGDERYVSGTSSSASGAHTDAAARAGSGWVETYLHWVGASSGQEYVGHVDYHADSAHTDTHGDTAHADTHSDTHSDVSHADTHSDTHSDTSHADTHSDMSYVDYHYDHSDYAYVDTHGDVAHTDSHSDTSHADTHSDVHSDVAHADTHADSHSDSHSDYHNDLGHQDTHNDAPEEIGL